MTPLLAIAIFANLSLDRATAAAVASSPTVAAADAQTRQDAAVLAAARAALAPSLSSTYVQAPQGNPSGPNVTSRLVTVGLQETLTDLLGYPAALRQSALTLRASQADRDVAVRDERVRTAGLYYDALEARSIETARASAVASARDAERVAALRYGAGDVARLDVLRARVAVARAEADLEAASVLDENAEEALLVETGLPETTDLEATVDAPDAAPRSAATAAAAAASAAPATASPATAAAPEAAVSRALANRAELASLRAAADAASAGRSAVAGAAFPVVLVGAGYTAGTDSGVPVGSPSVNASLLFPLGSGARDRVRAEDAKIAAARARFETGRRAIVLEVGSAARSVASLERSLVASERARRAADEELAATSLGYRSGASSSLELEAARTTDASAAIDELGAAYELAKARAVLALEVGR